MAALLRWQQTWAASEFVYLETWVDAFSIGSVTLDAIGHSTFVGDTVAHAPLDLVPDEFATVGRTVILTDGISYQQEDILAIAGSLAAGGRTTIEGELDFEEPYFVDPPLILDSAGHSTLVGDVLYLVETSIGPGSEGVHAHLSFGVTTLNYQIGIVKQLFSVSLAAAGHATASGDLVSTTIKEIGSGVMEMGGRSVITQTGFAIDAPEPYTHPVGSGVMPLVGGTVVTGDVLIDTTPPHDIGAGTMAMTGKSLLSVASIFAGGPYPLLSVQLGLIGRSTLRMGISYPGGEIVQTEIFAVYEGVEMQEASATAEGGSITVG